MFDQSETLTLRHGLRVDSAFVSDVFPVLRGMIEDACNMAGEADDFEEVHRLGLADEFLEIGLHAANADPTFDDLSEEGLYRRSMLEILAHACSALEEWIPDYSRIGWYDEDLDENEDGRWAFGVWIDYDLINSRRELNVIIDVDDPEDLYDEDLLLELAKRPASGAIQATATHAIYWEEDEQITLVRLRDGHICFDVDL